MQSEEVFIEVHILSVVKGILCLFCFVDSQGNLKEILRDRYTVNPIERISIEDYFRTFYSLLKEIQNNSNNDKLFPEVSFQFNNEQLFQKFKVSKSFVKFQKEYLGNNSFDPVSEENYFLQIFLTEIKVENENLISVLTNSQNGKEVSKKIKPYISEFNQQLSTSQIAIPHELLEESSFLDILYKNRVSYKEIEPHIDRIIENFEKKSETILSEKAKSDFVKNMELLKNKKQSLEKQESISHFFLDENTLFFLLQKIEMYYFYEEKKIFLFKLLFLLLYFTNLKISEIRLIKNCDVFSLENEVSFSFKSKKKEKTIVVDSVLKEYIKSMNYRKKIKNDENYLYISQKKTLFHEKAFLTLANNILERFSVESLLPKCLKTSDFTNVEKNLYHKQ